MNWNNNFNNNGFSNFNNNRENDFFEKKIDDMSWKIDKELNIRNKINNKFGQINANNKFNKIPNIVVNNNTFNGEVSGVELDKAFASPNNNNQSSQLESQYSIQNKNLDQQHFGNSEIKSNLNNDNNYNYNQNQYLNDNNYNYNQNQYLNDNYNQNQYLNDNNYNYNQNQYLNDNNYNYNQNRYLNDNNYNYNQNQYLNNNNDQEFINDLPDLSQSRTRNNDNIMNTYYSSNNNDIEQKMDDQWNDNDDRAYDEYQKTVHDDYFDGVNGENDLSQVKTWNIDYALSNKLINPYNITKESIDNKKLFTRLKLFYSKIIALYEATNQIDNSVYRLATKSLVLLNNANNNDDLNDVLQKAKNILSLITKVDLQFVSFIEYEFFQGKLKSIANFEDVVLVKKFTAEFKNLMKRWDMLGVQEIISRLYEISLDYPELVQKVITFMNSRIKNSPLSIEDQEFVINSLMQMNDDNLLTPEQKIKLINDVNSKIISLFTM